ncbi:MAG: EamA family transporter [Patescibacteria group bacterium]|nr:EamA family transporter [Patescibacteria group bacterium]
MFLGILISLLNPFFASLQNVFAQIGLKDKKIDDLAVVFARLFYVVPILLVFFLIVGAPSQINPNFFWIMMIMVLLEIPSQWFFHQSIKMGQLSVVMPISTLIAIPMLSSFWFFGGWSWLGLFGALFITVGIYVLQASKLKEGDDIKYVFSWSNLIKPIKSLFKEKSSRFMLITIVLWSITTPLQKLASSVPGTTETPLSNVAFMGVVYLSLCSLGVVFWSKIKSKKIKSIIYPPQKLSLMPIGGFAGFGAIAQYWALSILNPVYVIALKETILIWTVIWDVLIFKQKISVVQLISIVIVMIGAALISVTII